MKKSMKKKLHISIGVLALGLFFIRTNVNAQFTISESFKNRTANNSVVLGGSPSAYLTSGSADGQGNGWLRLTNAIVNQKGYAYIDKSFPSSLGVFVDFEYKAWRTSNDAGYGGADGFSVFLFDASVPAFKLGGYGGSLGYAPITGATNDGLAGGYVGIGLDEYGNFSNPTEGRNGGPGLKPNSIVLRGPTTSSSSTTNKYLSGEQLVASAYDYTNKGIDYDGTFTAKYNSSKRRYDTTRVFPSSRPGDDTYYRRVQISIVPDNGEYDITVKMAKTPGGAFTQYITYKTTTPPPANLKLGFAASTGGGYNYHEIRNLYVTTPGGVRVDKSVDKTSAAVGSHIRYTVDAYNATTSAISNLVLRDTLRDGNGNIIPSDEVSIDNIVFNNNGNSDNQVTGGPKVAPDNTISATLSMGASTTANGDAEGTFTVYATIHKRPAGGIITNRVFLDPQSTGITDGDMTNNYASASTTIISNDLAITAGHNGDFNAGDKGKNLVIHVTNNGPDATGTTTTVTDTLPAGLTYAGTTGDQGNGWSISVSGNIVTAVYNGSVSSGDSFPDLDIPVNVNSGTAGQTLTNKVSVQNDADDNLANNDATDDIHVVNPTGMPVTLSDFTGSRVKNANELQWTTATEINNKGFELQRSIDNGATWQDVTFVPGHGTSSVVNGYSYTDADGAAYALAMYRLGQTDLDGKVTLENKIVTISGAALSTLSVYPNPAHGTITIGGLHTGDNVTVYSTNGRAVKHFAAASVSQQVDISDLLAGVYYIKVSGTAGNSTSTFIVK